MMASGFKHGWSPAERIEFYSIPEPNSGCKLWFGSTDRKGYPKLWAEGKLRVVSHLVLETAGHSVPSGMCVCHRCDNPACVEETHLFIGTQKQNIHDMIRKGRQNMTASARLIAARMHCGNGHQYPDNPDRSPKGHRICPICAADKLTRKRLLRRDMARASNRGGATL